MPKMKTNSGAKKRFDFTGSGKIKRKHAYKSHILTKKTTKTKTQPDLFGSRRTGQRSCRQTASGKVVRYSADTLNQECPCPKECGRTTPPTTRKTFTLCQGQSML